MQDTFGPRIGLSSFEFHRGIDIPTGQNTPVRAILKGTLRKIAVSCASDHLQYRVEIEHEKTLPPKVFRSTYHHLKSVKSTLCAKPIPSQCPSDKETSLDLSGLMCDTMIQQDTEIGYSGYDSDIGFPHLHFEIRDPDPVRDPNVDHDPTSQKQSVHPLRVLPYTPTLAKLPSVACVYDKLFFPLIPCIVTMHKEQQDLARVELFVLDSSCTLVQQDEWASAYDFDLFNLKFTHTSKEWPIMSSQSCPYYSTHPVSYDPNFHLSDSDFNKVKVTPKPFTMASTEQKIAFWFNSIKLPPVVSGTTILVRAWNIQGQFRQDRITVP